MKKTIIISLLTLASMNVFGQSENGPVSTTSSVVCQTDPNMPANAVPVWPKFAYNNINDPSCAPCYEYTTKHGLKVMECPFLLPKAGTNEDMTVQTQNTYSGNYPVCRKIPANAKAVWPTADHAPLANPSCAPCYEYTTRHGLKVMECPDALFTPGSKE